MSRGFPTRSRWLGRPAHVPAQRLVSLVPSLTLALFELGGGPLLVGRTRFCVEPRGPVDAVPVVGGTKSVHVDEVVALAPDVVLANREENVRERVEAIAEAVPVWLSDPRGPADAPSLWRELGAICGRETVSERRARELERALLDVEGALPAGPTFVYWVWREPWMAAGHDTYISRMLTAAGWRNALPPGPARYPRIEPAHALALGPGAMLFPDEPYAFALPGDLQPFGSAAPSRAGAWRVAGAAALAVDGRSFSWYPSHTLEGLRRAAELGRRLGP